MINFPVAAMGIRTPSADLWRLCRIWEFSKIRGTLFWGPDSEDPTI